MPLGAVRDLLGIVRALYGAWKVRGASAADLEALAAIGRDLRVALELARKTEPNSLGHRAAWSRAEDATQRLGSLIGQSESLAAMVDVATKRALTGAGHGKPTLHLRPLA